MAFKNGPLSPIDREYIKTHCGSDTVEEIAEHLNRSVKTILNFITKHSLLTKEQSEVEQKRVTGIGELHRRAWWPAIKDSITPEELKMFESLWTDYYVGQYKSDVLPTEEAQIKQLIFIELALMQLLRKKKHAIEHIKEFHKELMSGAADDNRRHFLNQMINDFNNALTSYTKEHTDLITKQQSLHKDLNSTREQRYDTINAEKGSFASWVKKMDDPEMRKKLGEDMDLHLLAMTNARQRLMTPHKYLDNTYDCPIYNSEVAENLLNEVEDVEQSE
jgi:hypothetical protein